MAPPCAAASSRPPMTRSGQSRPVTKRPPVRGGGIWQRRARAAERAWLVGQVLFVVWGRHATCLSARAASQAGSRCINAAAMITPALRVLIATAHCTNSRISCHECWMLQRAASGRSSPRLASSKFSGCPLVLSGRKAGSRCYVFQIWGGRYTEAGRMTFVTRADARDRPESMHAAP